MTIEIPDNLQDLAKQGAEFVVTPEAESALVALKKAQDDIDLAMSYFKEHIQRSIEEAGPTVKSVKGNRVTISVYEHGSKYALDESQKDQVDETLYTIKTTYSVDSDGVEKWAKEHGALPVGINKTNRNRALRITVKGE
jgi:hypothetical protein